MKLMRSVLAAAAVIGAALVFPTAAAAADKVCKLVMTGTDLMQYDKKELAVAAGRTPNSLAAARARR